MRPTTALGCLLLTAGVTGGDMVVLATSTALSSSRSQVSTGITGCTSASHWMRRLVSSFSCSGSNGCPPLYPRRRTSA
ncbi:hypothetical protein PF005_g5961 [Phytophthora fragariae]|uniref:RxLR effector protein n=1 Tax=Phytophthora fragariae TaxID=53985 RepID=A0A6A3LMR6_9STRA|nr:hypothetical protein PF003_g37491 [Phytophthora fragariae]KAE8943563.1 hypothetical protein PF009_g6717 [Phytophthora fragariae]KAE9020519.1 hypothetical protein PF011_g5375 [Phytophthora fragariae]KAE9125913.1 hypothetical protein PF007_g6180 [Phytophthora fragariae]KAE9150254.1 hypothetical protein PF006_g5344 [Phytophthora fragariae]